MNGEREMAARVLGEIFLGVRRYILFMRDCLYMRRERKGRGLFPSPFAVSFHRVFHF